MSRHTTVLLLKSSLVSLNTLQDYFHHFESIHKACECSHDCTCNKLLQLHFCCSLLLTFIGCHSCWALALVPHAFPKHALLSITDLVAFVNFPLSVKNVACETRPIDMLSSCNLVPYDTN